MLRTFRYLLAGTAACAALAEGAESDATTQIDFSSESEIVDNNYQQLDDNSTPKGPGNKLSANYTVSADKEGNPQLTLAGTVTWNTVWSGNTSTNEMVGGDFWGGMVIAIMDKKATTNKVSEVIGVGGNYDKDTFAQEGKFIRFDTMAVKSSDTPANVADYNTYKSAM